MSIRWRVAEVCDTYMTVGKDNVDEPVILWLSKSIEDQSFGYNPVEGGGQYSGNKPEVNKDQSSNMHHQDADQIPEKKHEGTADHEFGYKLDVVDQVSDKVAGHVSAWKSFSGTK